MSTTVCRRQTGMARRDERGSLRVAALAGVGALVGLGALVVLGAPTASAGMTASARAGGTASAAVTRSAGADPFAAKVWRQVSAGGDHTCAVDTRGKAYCWGDSFYGELGNGSTHDSAVPVAVSSTAVLAGKTLTQLSAGNGHTCAVDTRGKAYCWGSSYAGQLGDGSTSDSAVPVAVTTPGVLAGKTLTQVSAGGGHTCAVDTRGKAYCWGADAFGMLGDGSTRDRAVPVAVTSSGVLAGKTLTRVSAGGFHTCALDTRGKAYCWGENYYGQLGNGSASDSAVPVAVTTSGVLGGKTLTQVSAGWTYTCAVDTRGKAYCWGRGYQGQLGNGSTRDRAVPVAVTTSGVLAGRTLTQVSAGAYHACAVDTRGKAYCWGEGYGGALGNGSTRNSSVPVAVTTSGVLGGKTLTQVSAGGEQTCTVGTRRKAYCWGYDYHGQLGNGSTRDSAVPVAVWGARG